MVLEEWDTQEIHLAEPKFVNTEYMNVFRKFKLMDCNILC